MVLVVKAPSQETQVKKDNSILAGVVSGIEEVYKRKAKARVDEVRTTPIGLEINNFHVEQKKKGQAAVLSTYDLWRPVKSPTLVKKILEELKGALDLELEGAPEYRNGHYVAALKNLRQGIQQQALEGITFPANKKNMDETDKTPCAKRLVESMLVTKNGNVFSSINETNGCKVQENVNFATIAGPADVGTDKIKKHCPKKETTGKGRNTCHKACGLGGRLEEAIAQSYPEIKQKYQDEGKWEQVLGLHGCSETNNLQKAHEQGLTTKDLEGSTLVVNHPPCTTCELQQSKVVELVLVLGKEENLDDSYVMINREKLEENPEKYQECLEEDARLRGGKSIVGKPIVGVATKTKSTAPQILQ